MIVHEANAFDVFSVLNNLREHNRREFAACRWDPSPAAIAGEIAGMEEICIKHYALCGLAPALDRPCATCCCTERCLPTPIALAGAWLVAPGVALVRLCATDQWLTIAKPAYRWLKRVFVPCVLAPNVRRAETRVLDTGLASRAWLRRLGFHDEGIARALGKNGEDFVHVAWINPSFRRDSVADFAPCGAAQSPSKDGRERPVVDAIAGRGQHV